MIMHGRVRCLMLFACCMATADKWFVGLGPNGFGLSSSAHNVCLSGPRLLLSLPAKLVLARVTCLSAF